MSSIGPSPGIEASKADWRAWAKTAWRRRDVSRDADVVGHLLDGLQRIDGPIVTVRPLPDEVDLDPLMTQLGAERFVVTRTDGDDLTLHPAWWPVERHRLGFAQPRADAPVVPDEHIRAVLVPGRVFDVSGYRVGRGGGHYDRLLARLPRSVVTIGVGIDAVVVDAVATEPHDVAVSALVTESGWPDVGARP